MHRYSVYTKSTSQLKNKNKNLQSFINYVYMHCNNQTINFILSNSFFKLSCSHGLYRKYYIFVRFGGKRNEWLLAEWLSSASKETSQTLITSRNSCSSDTQVCAFFLKPSCSLLVLLEAMQVTWSLITLHCVFWTAGHISHLKYTENCYSHLKLHKFQIS